MCRLSSMEGKPCMQDYKTVSLESFSEYIEKNSRFLGFLKNISSVEEGLEFVKSLKIKYHDAKHHVYAYILNDDSIQKYSDDGEPQGTAGLPILNLIKSHNLSDCILVVVRYFGGTLLGTGGLARAYTATAKMAIENNKIIKVSCCNNLELTCEYRDFEKIKAEINKFQGHIKNTKFFENIKLEFCIKSDLYEKFSEKLYKIFKKDLFLIIKSREFCKF